MSDYVTDSLPSDEIDKLRFKAFRTNNADDMTAYYKATSAYFQDRHVRAMIRHDYFSERIQALEAENAALEAKLAQSVEALTFVVDEYDLQPRGPIIHSIKEARAILAQITGEGDAWSDVERMSRLMPPDIMQFQPRPTHKEPESDE